MKILYDHQIFSLQKYGGISRYFCELYSHLLTTDSAYPKISIVFSENIHYRELFYPGVIPSDQQIFGKYLNYGKKKVFIKINEWNSTKNIKKEDFDIFHPTYYYPYFLNSLKTKSYVLTVFDMIHEFFPAMVSGDNIILQKKKVIESATKIIAISENTKSDIIKLYNIESKKVEVIPLATSIHLSTPDCTLVLPKKYILFVGNRDYYKNFPFFINSIASILYDEKDLFLICAGGKVFSNDELRILHDLKIKKKVLHYPIANDGTLSQLYQKAILFVYPSLYEGFGIPILEAFRCGCPVAASNCSSLPEVGGEAVSYFDPNNPDSIQKVIIDIIHNNSLQNSLRFRGYERQKLFSWEKTALMTKNVYDNMLN